MVQEDQGKTLSISEAVDHAVQQSKLTLPGGTPFHLKAHIAPANSGSGYTAEVEEYWVTPEKWQRTIKSPDFSETLIVNGDKTSEQLTGDYYPFWLHDLVTALFDPLPMADQLKAMPGRLENIWEGIRRGERARVGSSLPAKLVISDNEVAIVSSAADYHNGVAYLIRRSSLLDITCGLFEAVWDRAVPLNRAESKTGEAPLSHRDRQLLGLLASGATDAVIARTFDWSIRTVQRHIHELMQQVGARTRFQVGMEAARRGWL